MVAPSGGMLFWVSPRRTLLLHCALLSLAVLSVYAVTLSFGFVWDDRTFIVGNKSLEGLSAVPGILLGGDSRGLESVNPYYRPVTTLTFALGRALFGERPWGYHGISVLLHGGACLAFYGLGRRILPSTGAAFGAALLFALHPACTEPVGYVSAAGDLLCGFFSALALTFCARHLEDRSRRDMWISAAFLAAALLSKEPAVVLPVLAFLMALSRPQPEGGGRRFILPWLWCAVAAAWLVLRGAVLAMQDWGGDSSLAERIAVAGPVLLAYVRMALFPVWLKVFHPTVPPPPLASPAVLGSWALLIALWCAVAALYRRNPVAAVGGAWFFLALLPVSGLVTPMYPSPMADRYLYVPLMGCLLALTDLSSRLPALSRTAFGAPRLRASMLAFAALALGVLSAVRLPAWHDSLSLWAEASRGAPEDDTVACNLGGAFLERGMYGEAGMVLEGAAQRGSRHPDLLANLAVTRARKGDFGTAEYVILECVRRDPTNSQYLRAATWILDNRLKRADALAFVRSAAVREPGNPRIRRLLAWLETAPPSSAPVSIEFLESL